MIKMTFDHEYDKIMEALQTSLNSVRKSDSDIYDDVVRISITEALRTTRINDALLNQMENTRDISSVLSSWRSYNKSLIEILEGGLKALDNIIKTRKSVENKVQKKSMESLINIMRKKEEEERNGL